MSKAAVEKTTIQLAKYGIIGVGNTLITLISFYVVNTICGFSYTTANIIGYVLGIANSFIWNRNWVFKTHNNWLREASLFLIGFFICYALQLGAGYYMLNHTPLANIQISWLPMKNPSENIVMCISMVIYTLANYCYNRFVTFHQPKQK